MAGWILSCNRDSHQDVATTLGTLFSHQPQSQGRSMRISSATGLPTISVICIGCYWNKLISFSHRSLPGGFSICFANTESLVFLVGSSSHLSWLVSSPCRPRMGMFLILLSLPGCNLHCAVYKEL